MPRELPNEGFVHLDEPCINQIPLGNRGHVYNNKIDIYGKLTQETAAEVLRSAASSVEEWWMN